MSAKESSWIDHLFIRAKDVCLLIAFVWGFLTWTGGWSIIPTRVEANEKAIVVLKEKQMDSDIRLARMEESINYLVKSVDEIKRRMR